MSDEPRVGDALRVGQAEIDRAHQIFERNMHENLGQVRWTFRLALGAMLLGVLIVVGGAALVYSNAQLTPPIVFALSGLLIEFIGVIFLYVNKGKLDQARGYLDELESKRSPWEAARLKIQYYMHENLRQVHWIFWLTLVAMFLGFLIIISGAALAYKGVQLAPSIVVTLSGVLVEFIGATFLLIYKSTMEQARSYVNILERINTVGMSLELIKDIDSNAELRNNTYAQIAAKILSPHGLGEKENKAA